MITLHDVEQGSEQWLQMRATLYTGTGGEKLLSHSGAIKIIDGIASAYALNEITGFSGNFYTKRGHILEDEAIELYQEIIGATGIRMPSGRKVGFVTNSRYPTCGYSPDDLYEDHTVEVKAFEKSKHLKMLNGDIPLKVLAQIHFGLLITGKKFCHLLPYNPDLEAEEALKIITIRRNQNIINNFKRKLNGGIT